MTPRIPLTEQLLDYLDGRLSADEVKAVERMLTHSERARERMDWIGEFQEQARRTRIEQPPATLRPALMETFRQGRQIHRAELLHDSRGVMSGVRSVGVAERWALIHTSDVADIAIDLARSGDRVEVSGQVLAIGDRTVRGVELLSAVESLSSCPADSYGQYACGEVGPGTYRLLVHLDDATVSVDLDLHFDADEEGGRG